jgi:PPOX class probable F420-dependent enzyme
MPRPPLPDDIRQFLASPKAAVMATVRADGQPVTVATWYLLEDDGRIMLSLDDARKRLDHLRTNPKVALTVLDDPWYHHVSVLGRVTELVPDPDLTQADRVSRHYAGNPYPERGRPRSAAWVTIDRWHGWGRFQR